MILFIAFYLLTGIITASGTKYGNNNNIPDSTWWRIVFLWWISLLVATLKMKKQVNDKEGSDEADK